uniref:Uncharacterized protein n=1 Tax=Anguilla anguilla TaxID=7936 RepID=A0A0E9UWT8_ANGAN
MTQHNSASFNMNLKRIKRYATRHGNSHYRLDRPRVIASSVSNHWVKAVSFFIF